MSSNIYTNVKLNTVIWMFCSCAGKDNVSVKVFGYWVCTRSTRKIINKAYLGMSPILGRLLVDPPTSDDIGLTCEALGFMQNLLTPEK